MYGSTASPGVISTQGDANAKRDAAGRKALQEQAPGDEFVVVIPDDLQDCLDRLDEIRTELGELSSKMYAVQMNGAAAEIGYVGAPAAVKLALRQEMDCLEVEETLIQARVMELQWAVPPHEESEGEEKAEGEVEDEGDPTQPGEYESGPARDSAQKAIGWPDREVVKSPAGGSASGTPPEVWGR